MSLRTLVSAYFGILNFAKTGFSGLFWFGDICDKGIDRREGYDPAGGMLPDPNTDYLDSDFSILLNGFGDAVVYYYVIICPSDQQWKILYNA
ncbi:MAG: hypothetical protein IPP22_09310 [Nitrosomonas sp.]|nr:hypothetical protein [Nitrosomonas sp.]